MIDPKEKLRKVELTPPLRAKEGGTPRRVVPGSLRPDVFPQEKYKASEKASAIVVVLFLSPVGDLKMNGRRAARAPQAYLSRWRVNSGDWDVPEFITR